MDPQLLAGITARAQGLHDDYIALNRAIFLDFPPDDTGTYVYTYYAVDGYPLYHGYTTNARQRARVHLKLAPWASWAEHVRYRECSSPQQARKLESRLHRKVESVCGRTAYHGEDWSDVDRRIKVNHVTGACRLPGGICDPGHIAQQVEQILARMADR